MPSDPQKIWLHPSEFSCISFSAVARLTAEDEKTRQSAEQQTGFIALLQLPQPVLSLFRRQHSRGAGALDRGWPNHLHRQRIAQPQRRRSDMHLLQSRLAEQGRNVPAEPAVAETIAPGIDDGACLRAWRHI